MILSVLFFGVLWFLIGLLFWSCVIFILHLVIGPIVVIHDIQPLWGFVLSLLATLLCFYTGLLIWGKGQKHIGGNKRKERQEHG